MARKYFDGYGLTELRRYATEYRIAGRSKMAGDALLAAVRGHWTAQRVAAERAVLTAAGPIVVGTLLRHITTGTVMRVTSAVKAMDDDPRWAGPAPLYFEAVYVEVGERDGGLVGSWAGRGFERADYLNREDARRAENGETVRHMLRQHEAV